MLVVLVVLETSMASARNISKESFLAEVFGEDLHIF